MKVAELIAWLEKADPKAEVILGVMVGDKENEAAREEIASAECLTTKAEWNIPGKELADSGPGWIQINGWWGPTED